MCEGKGGRKGKTNGRKQQMWESNKCFRNTRKQQRIKITHFSSMSTAVIHKQVQVTLIPLCQSLFPKEICISQLFS